MANFLGVIGVVSSLIFVAIELQQNQKIALENARQDRTNTTISNFDAFTTANIDWQSFMLDNNLNYDYSRALIARRNT